MVLESMTAGSEKITMNAVTVWPHTKMGMRLSDMRGARRRNTVTRISTATASPETADGVAHDAGVRQKHLLPMLGLRIVRFHRTLCARGKPLLKPSGCSATM